MVVEERMGVETETEQREGAECLALTLTSLSQHRDCK